jgi:hypothetical protein
MLAQVSGGYEMLARVQVTNEAWDDRQDPYLSLELSTPWIRLERGYDCLSA